MAQMGNLGLVIYGGADDNLGATYAILASAGCLFDIFHAPMATAKHNPRHEEEEARSSPTIYPTLALGKEYAGVGLMLSFRRALSPPQADRRA